MSAARYIPRAPRYVFRPQDQRLMRFKGMNVNASASRAVTRDVSESGLSFIVDENESPFDGEILKIEFTLPGRRQIAWFATVARTETKIDWDPIRGYHSQTVIGLRFHRLSKVLSRELKRSLDGKVEDEETPDLRAATRGQFALFAALMLGALISLVVMTLPPTHWLQPFRALFR